MPRLDESLADLIAALTDRYGLPPTSSRPDEHDFTPFERLVRVALGLVAPPAKAGAALTALRDAGLLEPANLAAANPLEIDEILKQDRIAMAIKSLRPVQKLARWVSEQVGEFVQDGEIDKSTAAIRDEWRSINGIGLATADALLLHGLRRPSYPLDRATYRVFVRHGWLDPTADYDEARELIEKLATDHLVATSQPKDQSEPPQDDAALHWLKALGFWFERLGRDYCKSSQPRCEQCPLQPWLPPQGPVEGD